MISPVPQDRPGIAHASGRRPSTATSHAGALVLGLGVAVVARAALAGSTGAASLPAAVLFSSLLASLAWRAGWKPGPVRASALVLGAVGGAVLVAGPLVFDGRVAPAAGLAAVGTAAWVAVVSVVALAEESFFRGALWAAVERDAGRPAALLMTTVAFALIHVPLYGWRAVPLDLGVGLGLGALRIRSGGVAAPAVAHLLADVAGGWL